MIHIKTPVSSLPQIGQGTHVTTDDGRELRGISRVDVHIPCDGIIKADVVFVSVLSCHALATPTYLVRHPESGVLTPVKRIEFADGSAWQDGV